MMMYILALLLPPLACWGVGKFWHGVLNCALCLTVVGVPVAMIHAWLVVKASHEPRRRYREQTSVVVNVHAPQREDIFGLPHPGTEYYDPPPRRIRSAGNHRRVG